MSSQKSEYFFIFSLSIIKKEDWNDCLDEDHPCIRYKFLKVLENSKSTYNKKGFSEIKAIFLIVSIQIHMLLKVTDE